MVEGKKEGVAVWSLEGSESIVILIKFVFTITFVLLFDVAPVFASLFWRGKHISSFKVSIFLHKRYVSLLIMTPEHLLASVLDS
ncbi:hypothetical protein E2C01_084242 [Portunus trituberculatus]|uniref:Uncharacterized protein n=1 Tax=Portunus trituberculatus TaxID=210409 RepID=A0A5B7IZF1_PORTR|nr:hypothetical protein [Portunus trituberculatus]